MPHNTITVELNSLNSNTEITITDIMGKKIYVQKVAAAASTLDISDFQKGIYFLTITDGVKSTTRKFIKE